MKRITIKRLPVTILQSYHPMFGIVQPARFVYRIRVNGVITRSGVTSNPESLKF